MSKAKTCYYRKKYYCVVEWAESRVFTTGRHDGVNHFTHTRLNHHMRFFTLFHCKLSHIISSLSPQTLFIWWLVKTFPFVLVSLCNNDNWASIANMSPCNHSLCIRTKRRGNETCYACLLAVLVFLLRDLSNSRRKGLTHLPFTV